MKFRATIEQSGKTATGIRVPAEVVEHLGAGKRPAVRVTINGYTYRTTVGVMGGGSMLLRRILVDESCTGNRRLPDVRSRCRFHPRVFDV